MKRTIATALAMMLMVAVGLSVGSPAVADHDGSPDDCWFHVSRTTRDGGYMRGHGSVDICNSTPFGLDQMRVYLQRSVNGSVWRNLDSGSRGTSGFVYVDWFHTCASGLGIYKYRTRVQADEFYEGLTHTKDSNVYTVYCVG
jgi:hypothetical protein